MHYLSGPEETQALAHIAQAAELARSATCERSRCGSLIVKDGTVIGSGFNSPPGNKEGQRRCACLKSSYHQKVTDKTCCVHAEQRAVMDALRRDPNLLPGSRLYFIRLDTNLEPTRAGKPYCTICSKMALDAGIDEFVLWDEQGVCVYGTEEYNERSFAYTEPAT